MYNSLPIAHWFTYKNCIYLKQTYYQEINVYVAEDFSVVLSVLLGMWDGE